MKAVLSILIILHGLIHSTGFARSFNIASVKELASNISNAGGILWLVSALLFITTAILFYLKKEYWWVLSLSAILISQYLIFKNWDEAKFGTIANVIILMATVAGFLTLSFSNRYKNEVKANLKQAASVPASMLTEADMKYLPELVKKYLYYTGAVGKPKVANFKVEFTGQLRKDAQSEWMPFTSQQYNFLDSSTRLFFMKAIMKHLPVAGFHCFKNGEAFMDIRLLSIFKVQYQSGKEMDIAETVTFFNDLCCMAPATLIDQRIKWLEVEGNKVKATFTNNNITISAWLHFNPQGALINFVSDDRYAVTEDNALKRLRWSTPLKEYRAFDGHYLVSYADTIFTYPDGDFCYGNFRLTNIEYNCKDFKEKH